MRKRERRHEEVSDTMNEVVVIRGGSGQIRLNERCHCLTVCYCLTIKTIDKREERGTSITIIKKAYEHTRTHSSRDEQHGYRGHEW